MKRANKYYRKCAILVVLAFVIVMSGASNGENSSWNYKNVKQGVVRIWAGDLAIDDPNLESWATGSGFGIGKRGQPTDVFVTNRHVVADDDGKIQRYVYLLLDSNSFSQVLDEKGFRIETDEKSIVKCKVLYPTGSSPEYPDLAILRAERIVNERIAVPLRSGFEADVGDDIYTMGYPGSADSITEEYSDTRMRVPTPSGVNDITVTDGIISRTINFAEKDYTTAFQHTAHINHGNSGGPLVTKDGYVIGLNTWGVGGDEIAEYNLSFYVDYAMQQLDKLGIQYDKYEEKNGESDIAVKKINWPLVIAPAAGVLMIIGLLMYMKKPNSKPGPKPGSAPAFRLQGMSGVYAGKRFPIEGNIRIGRDPQRNDLVYPPDRRKISGVHCTISLKDNSIYIQDNGSKNGTYVNGRSINANVPVKLQVGDTIGIAGSEERFQIDISHHQ